MERIQLPEEFEGMYETIDLALAAFLKTKGYKVAGVHKKRNRRKATIFFEKDDNIEEDINGYFNGAEIPARDFFDNVRGLKSQIVNDYSGRD